MGFGPEQLRDKALLALQEAAAECSYGPAKRTIALRFALAYLWTYKPGDRAPFDDFWKALSEPKSPWIFSVTDNALQRIYVAHGLRRNDEIGMRMRSKVYLERTGT